MMMLAESDDDNCQILPGPAKKPKVRSNIICTLAYSSLRLIACFHISDLKITCEKRFVIQHTSQAIHHRDQEPISD